MYNCDTATGTPNCYNNMIDYINRTNPYIFCAQEATWFFPARPNSHTTGYPNSGNLIDSIGLNATNWVNWRSCCTPGAPNRQFDLF